ncbi:MAG: class I SAM-dependent methyltransferase [Chthoniobacteraceae bacterium]
MLWTITGRELRTLFAVTGSQHSDAAFGAITPDFRVELFECAACGFQFFDPALAGSGEFYAEADPGTYYAAKRPEFDVALRFARERGLKTVLDVGGGDGAFLDVAREAGMQTHGIELNPKAAAAAAAKGHTMLGKPFAEIDPGDLGGGVELMTFFHVVEHVPDPRRFLGEAQRLVKPGGFLMIALPNRAGIGRLLPYDPANMPPHHISRWRRTDLARLAAACDLRVVSIGGEVLHGREIENFWLLHNRLALAIGRPPRAGGAWLPRLLSLLYRKLGCRFYLPRRGFSIYAILQRP